MLATSKTSKTHKSRIDNHLRKLQQRVEREIEHLNQLVETLGAENDDLKRTLEVIKRAAETDREQSATVAAELHERLRQPGKRKMWHSRACSRLRTAEMRG